MIDNTPVEKPRKLDLLWAGMGLLLLLFAKMAHGAGFEKSVFWSGHYGGLAGAAVSSVDGAEALYFNPAGLITQPNASDLSLNFSPIWSTFKGPVAADNQQVTSIQTVSPGFGLLYARTLTDELAVGIGYYVAAGSKSEFDNVAYPPFTLTPLVKTDLSVTELSFGAGYKVMPGLRVGAAWRVAFAKAEFASVSRGATGAGPLQNLIISGLNDTKYEGFRLGVQYDLNEYWGLGASFRNELTLNTVGASTGTADTGAVQVPIQGGSTAVSTILPMQIAIGSHYELVPKEWRLYGEYVFTQYSRDDAVHINGTVNVGGTKAALPNLQLNWHDEHNVRLAGEWLKYDWPLRFGYIFTSAVTDQGYARASLVPPGSAHTFTLGSGHTFDRVRGDLAAEYTLVRGSTTSASQADTKLGDYAVDAYALHAGLTYLF